MKKFVSFLLAFVMIFSSVCLAFAVSEPAEFVTQAKTPVSKAVMKFSKSLGSGYKNAPTAPIVVENTIIVAAGVKLYKLNAQTGKEISSVKMQGSVSFSAACPLFANGKVFVQLDGAIIQAFDYKTMKSLWVYKDALGGQSLSPITYDDGYIYTGFWNGEQEYANYVCLSEKDENKKSQTESKKAKWTRKIKGGFYWAGCAVTKNFVVVGRDDGKDGSESDSKIMSINKRTGKLASSLSVKGDIRSTVVYSKETKSYYVSSKAGYVYKFLMDSSSGKLSSLKSYKAAGSVTATPVVHGGRLYFGCQNKEKGLFVVLNAKTMKKIYQSSMNGYPQSTPLLSAGYEGKTYIYLTYNAKPGGITMFEESTGAKSAKKTELFVPDEKHSQFCISPITAGSDGTLYYKNDSGYIIAVTQKSTTGLTGFIVSLIDRFFAMLKKLLGK